MINRVFYSALVGILLMFAAPDVSAMKVTVKGNHAVQLHFSCGTFCGNYWTLEPGQSASRPNEGGSLKATFKGDGGTMCEFDYVVHNREVFVVAQKNGENHSISCNHHP